MRVFEWQLLPKVRIVFTIGPLDELWWILVQRR